jgi:hypothetical protein
LPEATAPFADTVRLAEDVVAGLTLDAARRLEGVGRSQKARPEKSGAGAHEQAFFQLA